MGLKNTKYDKILILDADLSTDINELKLEWQISMKLFYSVRDILEMK